MAPEITSSTWLPRTAPSSARRCRRRWESWPPSGGNHPAIDVSINTRPVARTSSRLAGWRGARRAPARKSLKLDHMGLKNKPSCLGCCTEESAGTEVEPAASGAARRDQHRGAIEPGEVHSGRSTTWDSWPGSHPDWLRDKKAHSPCTACRGWPGTRRQPLPPRGQEASSIIGVGRAGVDAGTPKDRLEALRAAFLDTMKDPAYIAQAKKLKLDTGTLADGRRRGADCQGGLLAVCGADPEG